MNNTISSAGLVYVYFNGYEENGLLHIETVDSYRYLADAFYEQVMERSAATEREVKAVHVFAMLGIKERAQAIYNLVEGELKENFQRILNGTDIVKFSDKLDEIGNAFFTCAQEFFCEQPGHFPRQSLCESGNWMLAGICCSGMPDESLDLLADEIVSLWLAREEPCLCGKQMMIRSFFLRDIVGRKVIACVPQAGTGEWSFVFEGGHCLSMGTSLSYTKETIHPNELGGFSSSNLQTIQMNPVYAYGLYFSPLSLCEEWHKVFLYLCAVSECVWDAKSISEAYEKFLEFLQEFICETTRVETILTKEVYHAALLRAIQGYRDFLKGEDEPVISKDLHQTMNSRYVYLSYLWSLVPHVEKERGFSADLLHNMVREAVDTADINKKGTRWEDTVAYVLESVQGWKITGRCVRAGSQQIDISVVNVSLDDALWKLGAYILVECKNWRAHVNLQQVRNVAHISNMKGNKTVLFFSAAGMTIDAEKEINRLLSQELSIICITADDLMQIQKPSDCKDLILRKWWTLRDTVDITAVI